MQFLLVSAMAMASEAMVADIAAMQRAKHGSPGSMMLEVDPSGLVEEVANVNNASVSFDACTSCCASEYNTLWESWKTEQEKGGAIDTYQGYKTWNDARLTAFKACGALSTDRNVYLRETELFFSWGQMLTEVPHSKFCAQACSPPPLPKMHPIRVAFAAGLLVATKSTYDAENEVVKLSEGLLSVKPYQCKAVGCFKGTHTVGLFSATGTFCVQGGTASINVCKTKWTTRHYKGTCSGITASHDTKIAMSDVVLSGGTGSCKSKSQIRKILCSGNNVWKTFLNYDQVVTAKPGKKCLLEEFADEMELSIDETLDHEEHGPHAENMLVDCYRNALIDGVSLVEESRKLASHLKHQLEDRHVKRALALFNELPEEDKTHRTVDMGTTISIV